MKCLLIFTATVFVGALVSTSSATEHQHPHPQQVRYVLTSSPPGAVSSSGALDSKKIHEDFVAQFKQQQRQAYFSSPSTPLYHPQPHSSLSQSRVVTVGGGKYKNRYTSPTLAQSLASHPPSHPPPPPPSSHPHGHGHAHSHHSPISVPVQQVQLEQNPSSAAQAQAQTEAQIIQYIVQQQQLQAEQQSRQQAQAQAQANANAHHAAQPERITYHTSPAGGGSGKVRIISQPQPQLQLKQHPQQQPQQFLFAQPGRPPLAQFLVSAPLARAPPPPGHVLTQFQPQFYQIPQQQAVIQPGHVVKAAPAPGKTAHHKHIEPAITVERVEGHTRTFAGPGFATYSHSPSPAHSHAQLDTAAGTNAFIQYPSNHPRLSPGHQVSEPTVTFSQVVAQQQQHQHQFPPGSFAPAPAPGPATGPIPIPIQLQAGPGGPGLHPAYQYIQYQPQPQAGVQQLAPGQSHSHSHSHQQPQPQPQTITQVQIQQAQVQQQQVQPVHHPQQPHQPQQIQHIQQQPVQQIHVQPQTYHFQQSNPAPAPAPAGPPNHHFYTVKQHQQQHQPELQNYERAPQNPHHHSHADSSDLHGLSKVPLHSFAQIGNSVQELNEEIPRGFGLSL